MTIEKRQKRPRRRWWQVLCRAAVLLGVVVTGAYVTIPWWAPTGYLRDRIAEQMRRQMGVDVRIAEMSLSWSRGVELHRLTIASPEGFEAGPMVVVERISGPFSPIDLLFNEKLEWMELERPMLSAQLDEQGNINIAVLKKLHFDVKVDRVSVKMGCATLAFPGSDDRIRLNVSDLRLAAGRVHQLGRVTLSADLAQRDQLAPVSLTAGTGSAEQAAAVSFNFSNVDLEQLPLARLLHLPLSRLAGRCNGTIGLQVNRDGRVDRFNFNLTILGLDVQPDGGPRLPVIERAGLRISAAFDLVGERVQIQSASVRLPGVDLSGRADLSADVLEIGWQAIRSLELEGVVHPMRLMALATGRTELPGALETAGPVKIKLSARSTGSRFRVETTADAAGATIRRAGKTIKPPGRALGVRIIGDIDRRNQAFVATSGELTLGGNTFSGSGSLQDLRAFADRWTKGLDSPSLRDVLQDVARLDWKGSWRIRDLSSLRELGPAWSDALSGVELRGEIGGNWSIGDPKRPRLHLDGASSGSTHLAIGELFVKPKGKILTASLTADIDERSPGLRNLTMVATVGAGRFRILDGTLLPVADEATEQDAFQFDASGRFDADQIGTLQACFPWIPDSVGRLGGEIKGDCLFRLGRTASRIRAHVDLTGVSAAGGEYFVKSAGQVADVDFDFFRDTATPADCSDTFCVRARLPQGRFDAVLLCPWGRLSLGEGFRLTAGARIDDARGLIESSPWLKETLAGCDIGGGLELDVFALLTRDGFLGDLRCNADQLEFTINGPVKRTKAGGVPLRLGLSGRLSRGDDRAIAVRLDRAEVKFAAGSARISGRMLLHPERTHPAGKVWPVPLLDDFRVSVHLLAVPDEHLISLAPELSDPIGRYELKGAVAIDACLEGRGGSLSLKSHVDGRNLSANFSGKLLKPSGMRAEVDVEMTAALDLSTVRLNNLKARVGDLSLLVGASAKPRLRDDGLPAAVGPVAGHAVVSTLKTETLSRLAPALLPFNLAGAGAIEWEWSGADGGRIKYLRCHGMDLRGRYRAKDVAVRGDLTLENIRPRDGDLAGVWETLKRKLDGAEPFEPGDLELFDVGRIRTDALELRAGKNHGWLVADVSGFPAGPKGNIRLFAEYLDDKDLADWLGPGGAAPADEVKLTDEEIEALRTKTERKIEAARPYLLASDLKFTASIENLRSYDPSVRRTYDVSNFELVASLEKGRITLNYLAGMNGGIMPTRFAVDIADAAPVVSKHAQLRELVATENIQPQLAKYFPGNTVLGFFNRREKVTIPLRDVIANAIDVRYPMHTVGQAKTVTIKGVVEGRAAPAFIGRIFPGLNIAKYHYDKMTGFADFLPDGTAVNDMIFSGRPIDLYIEGTTDTKNIARYEIGVILLGTPQSPEFNHKFRQGRIPIMKFKGLIEGGKILNEQVSYLWPPETFYVIFLKNNAVYRIWLNAQKR